MQKIHRMAHRIGVYVRAYTIRASFYFFFVLIFITRFFREGDLIFIIGSSILAAAGIAAYIVERRMLNNGTAKEKRLLANFLVHSYSPFTAPLSSLFYQLKRRVRVAPGEIKKLYIQTCDFSNPYLYTFRKTMGNYGVEPDKIEFQISGFGDKENTQEFSKLFPQAKIFFTQKMLKTHFNIIQTMDRTFIWYEPFHDHHSKLHFNRPEDGAFLMEAKGDAIGIAFDRYNADKIPVVIRSEEHTSELQSH